MKLLLLKGLPASGKSTFAKNLALQPDWKRVNRDLMREMIDGGKWNKKNEDFIRRTELILAAMFIADGYNVVVDDTNLSPAQQEMWKNFVGDHPEVEVETKFFEIDPKESIKRDLARPISVGSEVIMRMYNDYLKPPVTPYKARTGAPKAIVVDVDGTAAHMTQRGPYDFTKYHTDAPDPVVRQIVNNYAENSSYSVIFCSGRDDTYMDVTQKWLIDNGFKFDALFMRKAGDKRNDAIVKRELFEEHIAGYDVEFVLDDRDRVVEMWREMGLKCLQVAPGAF